MIHTGDCVEVMAGMDAASVDAIVTDSPYGLEFMGKEWDRLGATVEHPDDGEGPGGRTNRVRFGASAQSSQQWHQRWATEALRVAKPGAYLLAFGGTRTYHRMTCAIEDAGWIIRDCLVWAYASGFPKSRALLKPAWEPIVMARKPGPLRELAIDACRIGTDDIEVWAYPGYDNHRALKGMDTTKPASVTSRHAGRWPANLILTDPIFDGDTPGVVSGGWQSGGGNPARRMTEALDGSYHGNFAGGDTGLVPTDTDGTYSRFFLVPKSDRSEREPILRGGAQSGTRFNTHPT